MSNNPNDESGLNLLTVFLAVVEAGGFRAAAQRLRLSPSTVSERIAQLEAQLGVPLLIRTTRSVMPTETGRALAGRVAPLLAETRAALHDAASSQQVVRGLLKINVTGAVMVDILPPIIDRFLQAHPEVRVEIMVDDRLVDIVAAGCDAGIRYGEHLAQDTIAVPIGPRSQRIAWAAAPGYLAARGIPRHPDDLLSHDCIRLRFSSGALVEWRFKRGDEAVRIDSPGRLIVGVDGAAAAIEFACGGRGVIGTFENWLAPHLESGALEPVLQEWWHAFEGPQLYFSSRFVSAPLRAFIELIREEQSASGGATRSGEREHR
ncbi:LysR family transcriptional regulator [Paraburkholderia sp. D15]|uniref:LysR family transcriptional regulator n=1 Tax=Paraburkholderia sp. D15 TaxID=2880218 RepID=UPI00247A1F7F|nr:LysR family transcriptional regulator [Paraburkholderia sp. D15]WGS54153.1 LysR family transcriptional regulator [Paraburkholderia sp. D15]